MKKLAGLFSNPTMATNNIEDYRLVMSDCLQIIKRILLKKTANTYLLFTLCYRAMKSWRNKETSAKSSLQNLLKLSSSLDG